MWAMKKEDERNAQNQTDSGERAKDGLGEIGTMGLADRYSKVHVA
jgi:hypothetical protein